MSDFEDKDLDDLLNEEAEIANLEMMEDDLLDKNGYIIDPETGKPFTSAGHDLLEEDEGAGIIIMQFDIPAPSGNRSLTEAEICSFESVTVEIHPTIDSNYIHDPYFKVYNARSYRAATAVARLYIKRAQYVKHHSGMQTERLDRNTRKKLVEALSSIDPDNRNHTYWDKMLFVLNEFLRTHNINIRYTNPMPNYVHIMIPEEK
jgi:hypothetical protein